MELKQIVLEDMKAAMREKNQQKLEAVRAVKAAIDKFEKENPGQPVNYPKALKPLVKQRMDSIEQYKNAGNTELQANEQAELDVINSYMSMVQPEQLNGAVLESLVKKYISENSLTKSDMGKVMSYFKANYDGSYDGKELSMIVKNSL